MDFSNLKINCVRLPTIFSKNSLCISEKEEKRITDLLLKESVKGDLTDLEYARLEFLQEKQNHSSPHLVGSGAQAYLLYIYSLKKYGEPAKLISDSFMESSASNGILKENYVIKLIKDCYGITIFRNKARIKNDFLLGIPDAFDNEDWTKSKIVHEIKTTSNRVSFLAKKRNPVTTRQFLQLQGYMALTDKKKAAIHHCLVDFHEKVIEEQRNKLFDYFCPDGQENSLFREAWATMEGRLRFTDMKPEERIFTCYVDRDERVIQKIYKRVQDCRDWINDFSSFNKEVESTGICTIPRNTYSTLIRQLGFE